MSSTLESYELIRFAEAFEARLATAGEMLAGRPGLEPEKRWLADALELVRTSRAPSDGMLERVKDLPELEEAREEYAFYQQGLWVDALEKLHAGITFTASSRAPVIEALFPHLKFPQLRRAPREAITEYATSYERRTKSAYVTRIFAREDFALVRPVMEQVSTAHAAWRSSHEPAPLTPEVEAVLREELVSLGRKLDVALRQARLLSEAALVPVPSVYEAAGLSLKPKRRAGRGLGPSADDGLAGLLDEPVDSMEPTEAELAEVAALDAGGGDEVPSTAAPVVEATEGAHEMETADAEAGEADARGADAPGNGTRAEANEGAAVAPPEAHAGGSAMEAQAGREASTRRSSQSGHEGTASGRRATTARGSIPTDSEAASPEDTSQASATGDSHGEEAHAEASETAAAATEDTSAPTRGARKGRKKADATAPEPEGAEAAQAPRVRKKKATVPGASGTDTP